MVIVRKKFIFTLFLLITALPFSAVAEVDYTLKLQTGDFIPQKLKAVSSLAATMVDRHIIVQFEKPLTEKDKAYLAEKGLKLLDYLPHFAYTAKVSGIPDESIYTETGVRWIGPVEPAYKISPRLVLSDIRNQAQHKPERVRLFIVFHPDEDFKFQAEQLNKDYGIDILGFEPTTNGVDVVMSDTLYNIIAGIDAVLWMEPALFFPEEHNNASRVNIGAETLQTIPYNLDGSGVIMALWDGGQVDANHPDFDSRVTPMDSSAITTHATHVTGTILGSGWESDGLYRGMAPAAEILSYLWWTTSAELYQECVNAITVRDADLGTNSWGFGVGDPATQSSCETTLGNYFAVCATIDNIVRGDAGKPFDIVWSAGNQRSDATKYCGSLGWTYNTVNPLACAKNVIAVGAINANDDSMTDFSSWGPTDDGRIKPDVVAPGCQTDDDLGVTSCQEGSGYTTLCGTSMSVPSVSGLLALMKQSWQNKFGGLPLLPSTVKGIIINTAVDLGKPGPDYQFGHGKVDGVRAVDKLVVGEPSFVESEIYTNDVHLYYLNLTEPVDKLKVTLVWDDPGGTVNSSLHLKNDLDLALLDPAYNEAYPWILDKNNPENIATRDIDRINNVETVEVDNPASGIWKARVSGFNIPVGPQKYSIIFTPDSVNIVNSMNALAVSCSGDTIGDPNDTVNIEFQVTNIGLRFDSVDVDINDSVGWVLVPVDTVLYLMPSETAFFTIPVVIPDQALAGENSSLSCLAVSKTNSLVSSMREAHITTSAVYAINVSDPVDDTVFSPDTFYLDLLVENSSNISNLINITMADEKGWRFVPDGRNLNLDARSSTNTAFSIIIPAEEIHLDSNLVTIQSLGNGGIGDTGTFKLFINNPLPPPALLNPDTLFYTRNRYPVFEWENSGDSFGLYLAVDSLMSTLVRVYKNLNAGSFTVPQEDSLFDGAYFWAVRKFVGSDSSSYQRYPRKLIVDNIPPDSLIPIYPVDNTYVNLKDFEFIYSPSSQPAPLEMSPEFNLLHLSRDYSMFEIDTILDSLTGLQLTIPVEIEDGQWFWRIQRYDLAGNYSSFSESKSFILDTQEPPPPLIISPVANAYIWSDTITFHWQSSDTATIIRAPEYYQFQLAGDEDFTGLLLDTNCYQDKLSLDSSLFLSDSAYFWRLRALDSAGFISEFTATRQFFFRTYTCGDINQSGGDADISDITFLISYLYLEGTPPEPLWLGSVDCNEEIDIADITSLIAFLYLNGNPLCCEPF